MSFQHRWFCINQTTMRPHVSLEFLRGSIFTLIACHTWICFAAILVAPVYIYFLAAPVAVIIVNLFLLTLLAINPLSCAKVVFGVLIILAVIFLGLNTFLSCIFKTSNIPSLHLVCWQVHLNRELLSESWFPIIAAVIAYFFYRGQNKTIEPTIHSSALTSEAQHD